MVLKLKKNRRNKRGSQVEFVVSFVLFVTFIIFVYLLLSSKIDFGQGKKNSLDNAETGILNIVTGNLAVTSVSVNSGSGSCFTFTGLASTLGLSNNIMAQNSSGANVSAYSDGTSISIDSPSTFFTIYNSPEFPPSPGSLGCTPPLAEGTGYTIGLSKNQSAIFETKILEAFSNYTSNYTAMKKAIQVFPGDDFGMKFTYQNGTVIKTAMTNSSISIFADNIPIQYVNQNSGLMQFGSLEVDVW
ncbi:MAG: hypothetical protein ABSG05_01005 [Candidatus Pacearchaeota archaeon]|jgi:hypothetical protein